MNRQIRRATGISQEDLRQLLVHKLDHSRLTIKEACEITGVSVIAAKSWIDGDRGLIQPTKFLQFLEGLGCRFIVSNPDPPITPIKPLTGRQIHDMGRRPRGGVGISKG